MTFAEEKTALEMNEKQYMTDRLEDQLIWYDAKSGCCQKRYKLLRMTEIFCATLIPLIVGPLWEKTSYASVVAGVLGVVVSIVAGVLTLYKFQENWIKYRTTAESLKHEKFLFLTRTDPYNGDDPFPLLVKRVESLISKENSEWAGSMTLEKKKPVHS